MKNIQNQIKQLNELESEVIPVLMHASDNNISYKKACAQQNISYLSFKKSLKKIQVVRKNIQRQNIQTIRNLHDEALSHIQELKK